MLNAYLDLPAWLRTSIAAFVLSVGVILILCAISKRPAPEQAVPNPSDPRYTDTQMERRAAGNLLILGCMTAGIGAALFLACGTSDAERKGYRF